jgi:hypothetical protein
MKDRGGGLSARGGIRNIGYRGFIETTYTDVNDAEMLINEDARAQTFYLDRIHVD